MEIIHSKSKALACKLAPDDLQKRKATIIAQMKHVLQSKQELPHGISCKFPATDDAIDMLTDFIKSERLCCDFFSFILHVEGDAVELSITGPEGTRQFIASEIGL